MGSRHRDIFRTVVLLASLLAQKKICLLFSLLPYWYDRSRKISCEGNLSLRLLCKGEADAQSDLDFLIFGRDGFRLTEILSLGEELQEFLQKKVDIFEIREVNPDSDFYHTIMKEKVLVA